jgi:DNA polymerase-3 subunit gamma/tau
MIKDYAPQAVFITKESWPTLRQEFLAGGQATEESEIEVEQEETEAAPVEPENDDLVTKAQELFGELTSIEEN